MGNCGAGSQDLEVCAQEKSIITLTNAGGRDFKPKVEEKKTRKRRKMTHMVQSSVSLMESINNVTFPALFSRVAVLSIVDMGQN